MNISKLPIKVAYCSEWILQEVYSKVSDLTCLSFLHQKADWFVVKLSEGNAVLCGNVGLSSKCHIKRQDFWKTKILLMYSHLMHKILLELFAYFMNNRQTWEVLTNRTFFTDCFSPKVLCYKARISFLLPASMKMNKLYTHSMYIYIVI